ncbi:citrate synthase/methylcitrate synthase [Pseudalkalibacillus caeni]|uniref:Citrate synthase n=1 Tax=Exobacillus caeni TaxID=2574798 RepID=A0A5R9F0Y1_9BACL|nr:citrate synthase/methylcitrate synthase [Pseudalkalibacillus caeni]TLS36086.1 citrate synthase/methylcitrate synthase [Pseudalkalibacillus caeni]
MKTAGLEGVVAAISEISLVDGNKGHLVYRGHWAKDLAISYSFEEVAYLLWYGSLPNKTELHEFGEILKANRRLPDYIKTIIDNLPEKMELMSVLRTVVSAMGTEEYQWPSTTEQALSLTAVLPTVISYRYRRINGLSPIEPSDNLNHVANFLYMLKEEQPSQSHVKALSAYLILTMEHGMNASTFTARVIASTQSDLASAISGAIGAMKGPLHGGAPSGVIELLDEIGSKENAEDVLRRKLKGGERLMGFGHRVYKTQDPRAEALRTITAEFSEDDPWFSLANEVEDLAIELLNEYKPGRKLYTNVEFYAAAILKAIDLPTELFTSAFTSSRIIGWIANVLEQNENNRIIRPASEYSGPMPE